MRAVFLDRDGVLNEVVRRSGKPYPPVSEADLQIIAGVPQALDILKSAGFMLIVVTNQPDVARGTTTREGVMGINDKLQEALPLDAIFCCFHDDNDECNCRKPKPGLLTQAARRYNIDLSKSFMIGDRWRDIQAGRSAGCTTLFIDYGYDEEPAKGYAAKVKSLLEAVPLILGEKNGAD